MQRYREQSVCGTRLGRAIFRYTASTIPYFHCLPSGSTKGNCRGICVPVPVQYNFPVMGGKEVYLGFPDLCVAGKNRFPTGWLCKCARDNFQHFYLQYNNKIVDNHAEK